ncbi:MAG: winged helix-turn-helix transcriptional regulator [Peptococcaceae bacterium]|nr:winged helix-turn-helix transcriptional regulator [Peptococcaceae bacterium]
MDQLTNIFKILSDENRLRMIVLLYQEELCVCELSGILGIPQPRISQNLSKLRDLNLVDDERKEKFVFYSLRRDNKIFTEVLKNILDDLESYPQLVVDKNRLEDKETYLNQCCAISD